MALSTSNVQPRRVTEISFNGFTRLNFSRTSAGGTMPVFGVGVISLPPRGSLGERALPCLATVRTTSIRAPTGMRFKANQPARRAVDDNGFPSSLRFDATSLLMMAEGGKAKWGTSSKLRTSHNIPSPRPTRRGSGRGDWDALLPVIPDRALKGEF